MDQQLCQEAADLWTALLARWMFSDDDEQRVRRLDHARARAESRYWRRHAKMHRGENQTPQWFYKSAKAGY